MSNRTYPFTPSDLRDVADKIEEALKILDPEGDGLADGDWRWGLIVDIEDDADHVIGQIRADGDGWLGFYPKEIK